MFSITRLSLLFFRAGLTPLSPSRYVFGRVHNMEQSFSPCGKYGMFRFEPFAVAPLLKTEIVSMSFRGFSFALVNPAGLDLRQYQSYLYQSRFDVLSKEEKGSEPKRTTAELGFVTRRYCCHNKSHRITESHLHAVVPI